MAVKEEQTPPEALEDQSGSENAPATSKSATAREIASGAVSDLTANDIQPLAEPVTVVNTMRNGQVQLTFIAIMEEIDKSGLYRIAMDGKVLVPSSPSPELHACRVLHRLGYGGAIGFCRPKSEQVDIIILDIEAMVAATGHR